MDERATSTYLTSPHLNKYLNQGFRKVKDYENFCLFEKVEKGKVLYRECFHKFDLYGAEWANDVNDIKPKKRKRKRYWKVGVFKMTQEKFIEKMRELDPFFHEGEIPLEILYERYEIIVEEMERLEDIEDNTIQLKAHIDYLNEKLQEVKDVHSKSEKNRANKPR